MTFRPAIKDRGTTFRDAKNLADVSSDILPRYFFLPIDHGQKVNKKANRFRSLACIVCVVSREKAEERKDSRRSSRRVQQRRTRRLREVGARQCFRERRDDDAAEREECLSRYLAAA